MEMIQSDVFKKILKENREYFNNVFMSRRYRNIKLEPALFLKYVASLIEPVIEKNKDKDIAVLERVVIDMYDTILELCNRNLLGNTGKYPHFEKVFVTLLHEYMHLLFIDCDEFITATANGVLNIAERVGERVLNWQKLLKGFSTNEVSLDDYKKYGVAAAWVCGLAEYRHIALEVCEELDGKIFKALFDLADVSLDADQQKRVIDELKANPWITPQMVLTKDTVKATPIVSIYGGFTGFGGRFIKPPAIQLTESGFMVSDGESRFHLAADIYGHALINDNDEKMKKIADNKDFLLNEDKTVKYYSKTFKLPDELRIPVYSQASSAHTLCFTSPISHYIFTIGMGVK